MRRGGGGGQPVDEREAREAQLAVAIARGDGGGREGVEESVGEGDLAGVGEVRGDQVVGVRDVQVGLVRDEPGPGEEEAAGGGVEDARGVGG